MLIWSRFILQKAFLITYLSLYSLNPSFANTGNNIMPWPSPPSGPEHERPDSFEKIRGISEKQRDQGALAVTPENLPSLLNRAEALLNQSHYENTEFINEGLNLIKERLLNICNRRVGRGGVRCRDLVRNRISQRQVLFLEQQSNRILYPATYNLEHIQTVRKINVIHLQRSQRYCSSYCKSSSIRDLLLFGSIRQYNDVIKSLQHRGDNCMHSATLEALHQASSIEIPQACSEEPEHPVCARMLNDYKQIESRLQHLLNQSNANQVVTKNICYSGGSSINNNLASLLADIDSINEHTACSDFQPGEIREIPTERNGRFGYIIKKEPHGDNYTVPLALIFKPADDYDGSLAEAEVHTHYLRHVRSCMDQQNGRMTGPDGQNISVRIIDGENLSPQTELKREMGACISPIEINIQSENSRSYSLSYAADIDCPAILHELLHLLGLHDEYEERSIGSVVDDHGEVTSTRGGREENPDRFKPRYDCRVVQHSSVMANQYARARDIRLGLESSMLDPAHFYSILYGNCPDRSEIKLYRECSNLAYQTSQQNHGEADCLERKKLCEESNVLGRNKSQTLIRLRNRLAFYEGFLSLQSSDVSNYRRRVQEYREQISRVELWPDDPE